MKRDVRIDTLRALAILLIMYAHTRPPQWLYELRNFDVILMTFILGASYYLSTERKKKPKPYFSYFKRAIFALDYSGLDLFNIVFSCLIWFHFNC
ncbi:hypothetical protein TMUPMC115_2021 [Tetragenococcus muriaticus PMC-11-5]|uniref:Acyltransferase 3 domain-containing protein n=1 Tax=Tetragenococcus muriaticus PMC-11-5 TaxID=1302649 RepID=A0A091CCF3_9ENTE|nr:hypothetical protein [Tetragenococcus muriaticus]KFN90233.1 hypothetical protein TMUPMC115_2021 [Tetragenococcus muriaticus PMC-11-5]